MERKQTSTIVTHTQYGDLTTKTTRITQESRLDRSRRIASQNSSLFRFALSGTIVVLFFGLFLLIGTTDYYNANAQDLKWVDDNGQFIEKSYNIEIYKNNLLLNENLIYGTINNFTGQYTIDSLNRGLVTENYLNVYNVRSFTLSFDQSVDNNVIIFQYDNNYNYLGVSNRIFLGVGNGGNFTLLDNTYYYKILFVNLSTPPPPIDNNYELYEIKRDLLIYNNLGNIPVTNLENMNSVLFKPAVDIVNGMTDTATGALGFSLQAWNFVIDIWNRIWGG